ncbi:SDR family NAD(P)-dependent oxidoreductase [Donghicola mangrovi]|uniref:SDR family oxidoreductase n=1 Tax=Donghicola mangrovi TaxID=2729614 RepID=A0A850QBU4_9RHOB|nr:SDR family NAD(P)-dependent oxidoreductase [Donghicola mangrovi]NVO24408.1 SDR family oxidoreductase [Donghicola mangrovi]
MSLETMFNVTGKSVVVTGAAYGLGRAYAEIMAQQGALVTLIDLNADQLNRTVTEISERYGKVYGIVCDVTDRAGMNAAFDEIADHQGGIDVVFANAGVDAGPGFLTPEGRRNPEGEIDNLHDDHWDKVIGVNLTSIYYTMKLAARHMKRQGRGGSIIATSSIAAFYVDGIVGTPYMPAKAGVSHLVKQLAMELGRYDIRVNAICPGPFITNIAEGRMANVEDRQAFIRWSCLGRVAETDEIKPLALYLASGASAYVTGSQMVIDGGLILRPAQEID